MIRFCVVRSDWPTSDKTGLLNVWGSGVGINLTEQQEFVFRRGQAIQPVHITGTAPFLDNPRMQ